MPERVLPPLQIEFLGELLLAVRKLQKIFDYRVRAEGMTLARARMLLNLSKRDGMNQADLASVLDVEGPTIVRLIDGMEEQGWLERTADKDDRRVNRIALTEEGREAAATAQIIVDDLMLEVFLGVLDKDIRNATRALRTMTDNLQEIARRQSA